MQVFKPVLFKLVLALLIPVSTFAASIEVVQSIPLETTLENPKIRNTQQVWLEMISAAKKNIDLEQFYINNKAGESLEPVLKALVSAANRGVQIRFLVDIKFFKNYPEVPQQLSKIQNIQVRTIDFSASGGIQHAKFFIVDEAQSFVGSANFDWLALSHIHEVGLKVNDASMSADLETVFSKDWAAGKVLAGQVQNQSPSQSTVKKTKTVLTDIQLVASPISNLPKGIPQSLSALLGLLSSAKTSIKIQVYQYSTKASKGTWLVLDQELRKAAMRGVQVQLIVDAVALKNSSVELKALAAVKNIQVRAVTIPEFSGGPIQYARLIHSKYFTIDGTSSWVGTENWSEGYFTGSRNVGFILHIPETTSQLDKIFDQVWASAYASSL
jgi:phosphatidylserine/phosphatidylglycerophosphate/cardiolipin synthase-like enzyme